MTDKVVDASAVASLVFVEAAAAEIVARIEGHELYAPAILQFEMMNVYLKKIRRQPEDRAMLRAGFARYARARIEIRDVTYPEVIDLAERHALSAYDASYLWLARHLAVELVTLDGRLQRAAAQVL